MQAAGAQAYPPPATATTYAGAAHAAIVAVDVETGTVRVERYASVHDSGTIVNPALLHGQLHGGVALGIGEALGERILHDPTGRLLTDSFEAYAMPRAEDVPRTAIREHSCRSRNNAYGIKGVGENGTMGAIPAVIGAVEDALAPFGLTLDRMPLRREDLALLCHRCSRARDGRIFCITGLRHVTLTVNGMRQQLQLEPQRLLVHSLRLDLGWTGTHVGCERAECGRCLVVLDDEPVRSCNVLAVQADGCEVWTIEGLAGTGRVAELQEAFRETHAGQGGFCTPGMIVCAWDLLRRDAHPDEQEIRRALCGNICRCTGYQNIVDAIARAGEMMEHARARR